MTEQHMEDKSERQNTNGQQDTIAARASALYEEGGYR